MAYILLLITIVWNNTRYKTISIVIQLNTTFHVIRHPFIHNLSVVIFLYIIQNDYNVKIRNTLLVFFNNLNKLKKKSQNKCVLSCTNFKNFI